MKNLQRVRLRIEGRVQGVGFRPAVYRLTRRFALTGFVNNTSFGVLIEVQGAGRAVNEFIACLQSEKPRQAIIESLQSEEINPLASEKDFSITESCRSGDVRAGMPPDLAICDLCRQELFDSANRRCRYPFINCTDCGPRFSIIRSLPYDRKRTTMESFQMCPHCRSEFTDPLNRRFEAQPNACPVCGPKIRLINERGKTISGDPIADAVKILKSGKILAVKGIGGYHLCCNALDTDAIRLLRERKRRPDKSFAVMFKSIEQIGEYCLINANEAEELRSVAAPVVILQRKKNSLLAGNISPDTNDVGAFLSYSPLHCILLEQFSPLVMTSGNRGDEPIAINEDDLKSILGHPGFRRRSESYGGQVAKGYADSPSRSAMAERGASIADAALVHDRQIVRRCDDSVLKLSSAGPIILRRSRGYVPESIRLPVSGPPILACGAELKNTVCLTRGDQAFLSAHIGDLDDVRNYSFFQETVRDFLELLEISPKVVAHDLHPDYISTRYALARLEACLGDEARLGEAWVRTKPLAFGSAEPWPSSLAGARAQAGRLCPVQHHHAHIASCLAEHRILEKVIGIALDGTGFGPDGTIWGGEVMIADLLSFQRVGRFKQYPMPGGKEAILDPARMALSILSEEFGADAGKMIGKLLPSISERQRILLMKMVSGRLHSPLTSSAGRLFDAVAALLGLGDQVSYEGRAAVRLQTFADKTVDQNYPYEIQEENGILVLSFAKTVRTIIADLERRIAGGHIAAMFHNTVAAALAEACGIIRERHGLSRVALSGGVFQNDFLLEKLTNCLKRQKFDVYTNRLVPPNDGGISLGQAAVAAARSNFGF